MAGVGWQPAPEFNLKSNPVGEGGAMRLLVLCFLVTACSKGETRRPDTTERQRDSVIGASQLPGAAGVRGALRAGDSAAARNARLDSLDR